MEKQFLLKDITGRGYNSLLTYEQALEVFADYYTIEPDKEPMKLVIEFMDLGQEFNCEDIDSTEDFTATILIRTK
jgi:hypothetical protein